MNPFYSKRTAAVSSQDDEVKILKEEELMEFLELNEGPKAYRVLVIFKDLETARKCVGTGILGRRDPAALSNRRNRRKKKLSSYFNKEKIVAVA